MASTTTLSFKLGKTKGKEEAVLLEGVSVTQHASTLKRFSRSSRDVVSMLKRPWSEAGRKGAAARFWHAVKSTRGEATTFLMRLVKLPWAYWLRTRVLSWDLVRGSHSKDWSWSGNAEKSLDFGED